MNTELILTYENKPQEIINYNFHEQKNKDFKNTIQAFYNSFINDDQLIKISCCFLDCKSLRDMNKTKLTKTALKENGKVFFNCGLIN